MRGGGEKLAVSWGLLDPLVASVQPVSQTQTSAMHITIGIQTQCSIGGCLFLSLAIACSL
jgi:hypothetical protein